MPIFCLLLLLVLVSKALHLSAPLSIVNGRSLRVDIVHSEGGGGRVSQRRKDYLVTSIVACSSIDVPFRDYDPREPDQTGCNSPGFQSELVFPSETSLFKARQRYSTLFMRRRLVVMQSPVVYLQVHMVQENTIGTLDNTTEHVATTQYRVPEKVLPLASGTVDEAAKNTDGELPAVSHAVAAENSQEEVRVLAPGQLQWYEYTGLLLCCVGFVACLVALGIYEGSKRAKSRLAASGNGSYADKRSKSSRQRIATWFTAAVQKGVYTQVETTRSGNNNNNNNTGRHPLL